ncbi:MAG: ABC transporter ATP-binding protein [Pseudomonadota bacterium]
MSMQSAGALPKSALWVDDVAIEFGGVKAVAGVSLEAQAGAVTAVIGPNGAGKTTLFNVLSGLYRPTRGRFALFGEDVTHQPPFRLAMSGLSRTFQNLQVFFQMTAAENVMVGNHLSESHNPWRHLLPLPGLFQEERAARKAALEELAHVGLEDVADRPAGDLPYGGLKRLEIARALAAKPRVLLLDEPAAGCNAVETKALAALIRRLADEGLAVVLVEHDMSMVMQLCDQVVVLAEGKVIARGTPGEVQADKAVREAYLGTEQ